MQITYVAIANKISISCDLRKTMYSSKMGRFILTSDEVELLLTFESATSLEKLALALHKDVSNVSRLINRIAEKMPVVEKVHNKWQLTEMGRTLNQHTRDSIQFQQSLGLNKSLIRIGTNREFATRILAKNISQIQNLFPNFNLRICAYESGTEQALLNSQIDIGIDCERPQNPDISYKVAFQEKIVAVCSPEFKKNHLSKIKTEDFMGLPHLLCDRLFPDIILKRNDNFINVFASFNDVATTREVACLGSGWALLPFYAVQDEVREKKLVILEDVENYDSHYGVWWLRSRKSITPKALELLSWLKKIAQK